jgi:predicted nucleic acid-binding protein
MNVLVDTDIVIEVLRGRNPKVLTRWADLVAAGAPIHCTPITIAEIWAGARTSEHQPISRFLAAMDCVDLDAETGKLAGEFLHNYAKSHNVEIADALIAATVRWKACLWTRNQKHYPMQQVNFF